MGVVGYYLVLMISSQGWSKNKVVEDEVNLTFKHKRYKGKEI